MKQPISDKRRLLEIAAVVLTGGGKFLFMDWLDWKLPFILGAITAWSLYIVLRTRSSPGILRYWGFRFDNFKPVLLKVLPFGLLSLIACLVIGYTQNTLNLTWHILPILVISPIWGSIQQFLMIGLVAGNLQDLRAKKPMKPLTILLTAILFGAVHYPYGWLMAGTFALALFYAYIYLRQRNVWVLGLFHGWLGAFFFYTVVNRDPFLEVFGNLG